MLRFWYIYIGFILGVFSLIFFPGWKGVAIFVALVGIFLIFGNTKKRWSFVLLSYVIWICLSILCVFIALRLQSNKENNTVGTSWYRVCVDKKWKSGQYVVDYKKKKYFLKTDEEISYNQCREVFCRIENRNSLKGFFREDRPLFIKEEFDKDMWMYLKGYNGALRVEKVDSTIYKNDNTSLRNRLKQRLEKVYIERYGEKRAGLLLWLLIGDVFYIQSDEYKHFIKSGLVHLVAVSWGNLAYVLWLIYILCLRIPHYIRVIPMLGAISAYARYIQLDPSLTRALTMAYMYFIVLLYWRKKDPRRIMALSSLLYLMVSPFSLIYDLWFLLSYGALSGLLLAVGLLSRIQLSVVLKVPLSVVGVSIWAYLWTLPIIMLFMGESNVASIIPNLFVPSLILPLILLSVWDVLLQWDLSYAIVIKWIDVIYEMAVFFSSHAITLSADSLIKKSSVWALYIVLLLCWYLYKRYSSQKPV